MLGPPNHGLTSEFFLPQGHCYLWEPGLLWAQVTSNALIGTAHVALAATLAALVWRVPELPFKTAYLALGAFIITGGLTHFFDIWLIWKPDYWPDAVLRILAAAISVGTVLPLPPLIRKALGSARAAVTARNQGHALGTTRQDLSSLRAPLALIIGPLARLRESPELSDKYRQDLAVVCRDAAALLEHVDALLDGALVETR